MLQATMKHFRYLFLEALGSGGGGGDAGGGDLDSGNLLAEDNRAPGSSSHGTLPYSPSSEDSSAPLFAVPLDELLSWVLGSVSRCNESLTQEKSGKVTPVMAVFNDAG